MGGLLNKKQSVIGLNSEIGLDSQCNMCGHFFDKHCTYLELNRHKDSCRIEIKRKSIQNLMKDLERLNRHFDDRLDLGYDRESDDINNILFNENRNKNFQQNFIYNKKSSSVNNLSHVANKQEFKTQKVKPKTISSGKNQIVIPSSFNMKDLPFERKVIEFKKQLKKLKVDWREGYCTLILERDNFFSQSMSQFSSIDPYKELHINFKGEVSHDAGGIIREWFTIIFKEMQSDKLNLFGPADSSDFSYKIHCNAEPSIKNLDSFHFIGKIIAKALLDNLTINTCFNKLIYKMLLEEDVLLEDLVFIDKPLYGSLKSLLKIETVNDLGLYFSIQYESAGKLVEDELIPNGRDVAVTDDNLDEFIIKRIQHIQQKDKIFINEIKSGLYSLIPSSYIKMFNTDEFELLLNGQPFIDLEDWKNNSIYKGYKQNDKIIKNFWEVLADFSQDDLARFLQFCTGSSRVPLGGFSALESNRGNISKFCITKAELQKNTKNYIRAHTCFNRVDLPDFLDFKTLNQAMNFIINNEILGFGVD